MAKRMKIPGAGGVKARARSTRSRPFPNESTQEYTTRVASHVRRRKRLTSPFSSLPRGFGKM